MISLLLLVQSPFAFSIDYSCPGKIKYPVSLTFDDGPAGAKTTKVLDILKKKNLKGTFFVLGDNFDTEAKRKVNYVLLERMKTEGHMIGSHTFHHFPHSKVASEEAFQDIDHASELLKNYMDPILRLPYGDGSFSTSDANQKQKNSKLMGYIKEKGLTHVGWSIDTNDWNAKKRPYVLESMMKQICQHHGGVILFHDIQQNTVDHLEEWIDAILAVGHKIEPLTSFYKNISKNSKAQEVQEISPACSARENKPSAFKHLSDEVEKINLKIK